MSTHADYKAVIGIQQADDLSFFLEFLKQVSGFIRYQIRKDRLQFIHLLKYGFYQCIDVLTV